MALPSGDTITISSGNIQLRSRKIINVSMQIQDNSGGTNFDSTYDMLMDDIGGFQVNFDVQEDVENLDKFAYNVPTFSFSFLNPLSDNQDFGNILQQLNLSDLVKITVVYDSMTSIFICTKNDFKFSYLERKVGVTAYSTLKFAEDIGSEFDYTGLEMPISVSGDGNDGNNGTYYYITARDAIKAFIRTLGFTNTVIDSSFQSTISDFAATGQFPNWIPRKDFGFITDFTGTVYPELGGLTDDKKFYINTYDKLRAAILNLGIAEFAIIGNMFSESYYVRRFDSTLIQSVSISASDLESFELSFASDPVKNITITIGDGTGNKTQSFSPSVNSNATDEKSLSPLEPCVEINNITRSGSYPSPYFSVDLTDAGGKDADGTFGSDTVGITTGAMDTYKRLLSLNTTGIRVSGTILGKLSDIKPYSFFQLDTNISPFINSFNRNIRPSSLKWNFKEDKVEFEGYTV
jgi:hypothetical protein